MPVNQSSPCDPVIHALCLRLAKRIVHIFGGILMESERHEALTQTYLALREELDKPTPNPEV